MNILRVATVLAALSAGLLNVCVADQLRLDIAPLRSVLKADEKQTTWVRVALKGFRMESPEERPAANVAIVLDKSGSMQGEKIERAREAAIDAVRLLSSRDIVSVVTYDSTVQVLVPATRLTDPEDVIEKIRSITAGGNTALFGGVSKGAAEVRKFLSSDRFSRIILLSDGLANVGPSAPGELGDLGASLLKENISVTTLGLGLGYNEDLMAQLAARSGGNHYFIEQASELATIFRNEFDDVLSVVAQKIDVTITVPEGIRPVRVLGNNADIQGQQIVTRMAAVYSEQNRFVVMELELPPSEADSRLDLASVVVTYTNMQTHEDDRLSGSTSVTFSHSDEAIQASLNRSVQADVVRLVSSERNKLATKYLDEGNLDMCRIVLTENMRFLEENSVQLPEVQEELKLLADENRRMVQQLEGVRDNKDVRAINARKGARAYQINLDFQQRSVP